MPRPLRLPPPLQHQVEAYAAGLLNPPGTPSFDFAAPAGAPALVSPDSVAWQVFRNPVTMFIGGITAVLLELAEPRVRHGVWDHSNFRTEPLLRLQRTGLAAMITVYAAAPEARAMIARVNRLHARVAGTTPAGEAYRALDPVLLTWVQATAAYGFLQAYDAFARPLGAAERDAYWSECRPTAALYGADAAPGAEADWTRLLGSMRPRLAPSPVQWEFLAIMRHVSALPAVARPAQHLLIKAAIDTLPAGLADQLGLGPEWRLRPWQQVAVRTLARTADRLLIRSWPAVQACRRLGLPDDYLHRR